ncbi:transporter protein SFT2 [Ceratobasidium sp. AG-Ba]|nr:transporter protein SFT2 [Ceratobasidium sp. AG-Ba]
MSQLCWEGHIRKWITQSSRRAPTSERWGNNVEQQGSDEESYTQDLVVVKDTVTGHGDLGRPPQRAQIFATTLYTVGARHVKHMVAIPGVANLPRIPTVYSSSTLDKMPKGWLNLEGVTDQQMFDNDSAFSGLGLSRTQRLYGFVGCLAIGFVISILATCLLFLGALASFAILYTVGIIVSLIGTGFLIGFFKQLKVMFKPVRVVATIVFFATIGLVFVGAFVIGSEASGSFRN